MQFDLDRMWTETKLKDSGVQAKAARTQHGNLMVTFSENGFQLTVSESDIAKVNDMVRLLREAMLKAGVA